MGFDIRMNITNGSTSVMAQKSDKICSDLRVKVVPSMEMETDCPELDELVKKPPPAEAAAAPTLAADDEIDFPELAVSATNSATTTQHDAIFNSKISFPLNLTRMLESVESKGLSHIVHWSEDTKSFVICDIDLFLRDVLPKFFKSSEKTKIRSFYRKLNRWGFSMSRKNAYNPNNVWHHPDFDRSSAVRSLNQAMETGKATDFLNITSTSRGKKRRGNSKESLVEPGFEDDDDISTTAMDGTGASNLLYRSKMGASMPILPSQKSSMPLEKKRIKMSQSFSLNIKRQPKNRSSSMMLPSYQDSDNDLFDQMPSSRGGGSNATFDLLPARTPGMMFSSFNNCAPSSNIFALSAQEMLAAHRNTSTSNIGHRLPTPSTSQNNISSLFTSVMSKPRRRQALQSEMTEEEDDELMSFFGNFAQALPSPNEDDEDGCSGEPDPLPHKF